MRKIDEAAEILRSFGLPKAQQNLRSALTLLALAGVKPRTSWAKAKQDRRRTVDIMDFMRQVYGKDYKPNSRETIRRQTIQQFEQARLVDRNSDDLSRSTNSGQNCYSISDAALNVIRAFGTADFSVRLASFIEAHGKLQVRYAKLRSLQQTPLRLENGDLVRLSPGKHNVLQAAVVQQFAPRFAPTASLLYLGDTAKKHVHCATNTLAALQIPITQHDKLPDIVLYDRSKGLNGWIFLVEAATSHGPVSPKRHAEIESMLAKCAADRVYVTAFMNRRDFRRFAADIAWETEVWIAEDPDHMIHFNGPKFLGPYIPAR